MTPKNIESERKAQHVMAMPCIHVVTTHALSIVLIYNLAFESKS